MWKRVYRQLDFMTVIDRFLPEEAAWADVVLPAATYYEIDSYHLYRDHVRRRQKIIEPVCQARNDSMILAAIARHLGYGSSFPQTEKEIRDLAFNSDPEMLNAFESHLGLARLPFPERRFLKHETGHLRSDGKQGFPTPSGRFEFKSETLERYGYEPLPVYTDPRAHNGRKGLTLMLITGARTTATFNSQYLNRHEVTLRSRPALEIHPVDAQSRGIRNGDCVSLFTCSGEVLLEARVTERIRQGTVHAPYGGGGRGQHGLWRHTHINSVVPPQLRDPISGYPVVKAVMCEVDRVDEAKGGGAHSSRVLSAEVSAPD
jgi:anaerobic selenocysteine-containing dehydrogenase